jgi:hypothetical protein
MSKFPTTLWILEVQGQWTYKILDMCISSGSDNIEKQFKYGCMYLLYSIIFSYCLFVNSSLEITFQICRK